MEKINFNEIILKIASHNQPGGLNALTSARLGLDAFGIKEAVAIIGKASYIKKAEFVKIREGLASLNKIRNA
jgi:hypothetical protein